VTTTVRATALEVLIHDGADWQYDASAYAVTCSFGFDQHQAEATVRRTGGGAVAVNYWSRVQISMGATPGAGAALRFAGYVVPIDNQAYPVDNVLQCKGVLYRAAWVRNLASGGTRMAPATVGAPDEDQVMAILDACGVPYTASHIGGTGKALGSVFIDTATPLDNGPFVWEEGQAGLDYIERLDQISVPDAGGGAYRTVESLGGDVFRIPVSTLPAAVAEFSFTEGVDVLEARITRDPAGAANRVTVTGAPSPENFETVPNSLTVRFGAQCKFSVVSVFAPYLPAGLPAGPSGHPEVAYAFASPMIEKSTIAQPGDVISCQAVADYLLGEYNTVVDTLEFSTPRDDLLGPGQTVHLDSPRLGLTDPERHYWVQHLEVTLDERGAFTQRLRCLRRS
jgi:hypothetical protein